MGLAGRLFKGDRSVWIIFMLLCLVSLVEVYSATSTLAYRNTYFWTPIVRHATFLLMGFAAVLLLHNIPSRYYFVAILLLPLSIIMLIVTPFIGVSANEAHRWLSFMGIQFQPSEFAKLACIVFIAFMMSKQERFTPGRTFWIVWSGAGLTCLLILPENFSTAFLLFLVSFLMMIIGQAPWKKMTLLFLSLALTGSLSYALIRSVPDDFADKYMPKRAATWVGRIRDFGKDRSENKYVIDNDNYQVAHAKIAIARGGLFGKLPGRSLQRDVLPQAYSDFIYAIIIEEMGLLIGGVGVMLLYIFLMFRVAIIARRCEKLFPKYLALGCGLLIVIQAFMNMAVAVNLMPVTGQPLPLISRGGTSTMLTCFYFGIILSVSRFGAGMSDDEDTGEEEPAEPENTRETPPATAATPPAQDSAGSAGLQPDPPASDCNRPYQVGFGRIRTKMAGSAQKSRFSDWKYPDLIGNKDFPIENGQIHAKMVISNWI
ncbi:MAG: FtsW/RodA/SpoVE family cell cycle protein [Tannerella sp.]|jgi:cell division protein FtsW|nr:FtsW/RodA/SpoVE family cell cycle protein [Tannerella sp.]